MSDVYYILFVIGWIAIALWLVCGLIFEVAYFFGRPMCSFKKWLFYIRVPISFFLLIPGLMLLQALFQMLFS
jgi:hypothetical protein